MMMTNGDLSTIKNELKKRIKVAVEWDGREEDDKEKTYGVVEEVQDVYPLDELEAAVTEACKRVGDEEDAESYQDMKSQLKDLGHHVTETAKKIAKRADQMGVDVKKISPDYYDKAVKKFVEKHKKDCVLVAPDLWIPPLMK